MIGDAEASTMTGSETFRLLFFSKDFHIYKEMLIYALKSWTQGMDSFESFLSNKEYQLDKKKLVFIIMYCDLALSV